ncbi:MAG: acyltransferase [Clostridiales bacterium]|nr:acyltransferase [Clostridiales bacterium]
MNEGNYALTAGNGREEIIDIMKGVCIVFVIMMHSLFGTWYKVLLMPFTAQLGVPFFLLISGYTYYLSLKNKNWFSKSNIIKKLGRIIVPLIPVLIVELVYFGLPDNPVNWLLSGGHSMPGSYYIVLLFQCIIYYPFLKWICEKLKFIPSFLLILLIHAAFELLAYFSKMDVALYRLLIFRYTVFLYGGIQIFRFKNKFNFKKLLWIVPVGLIYILAVGYFGWKPQILFSYDPWYKSAMPVAFAVIPIGAVVIQNGAEITAFLKGLKKYIKIDITLLFSFMGKASMHIYLIQMLWFGIIGNRINAGKASNPLNFLVGLAVSCIIGCVYYLIEARLRKILMESNKN